jgi:thymidylate synthase ThyX
MTVYVGEEFTPAEADVLRRYFTNLDGPVFALVNLPEVVKGALFARYSRSPKSLRRLFLDEFVGELDISGDASVDATIGLQRAEELYDRVFFEYGDDSVAQLGGVHLACEQASNLLTKVLEWGRLMSYLEQSTRYIAYDGRLGGRYRYHRDPAVLGSSLGLRYVGDLDRVFDTYAEMAGEMVEFVRARSPKEPGVSDFVHRQAVKAKALDTVRGLLPAASLSNVGIYGSGQAYEALLLRMRAHPLAEARSYADLMLTELRKVIPSFLKRVDVTDRGVAASAYLATTRTAMEEMAAALFPDDDAGPAGAAGVGATTGEPSVSLVEFDPDAELKLVASMLYPYTDRPEVEIEDRVRAMTVDERLAVVRAYVGERANRRHRPGRAFERPSYRFDVLADYGAFRDLQRHRMLTIEWQPLSPRHGYTRPEAIDAAGLADRFDEVMARSAALHDTLAERFPAQAPYAVSLAYRVRYAMQLNARSAMHLIELRSAPQGHPAYRKVAQEMHRLIAEQAGHTAVAEAMRYADHSPEQPLERLAAEQRAELRRLSH